jgi:hypothetical protein
VTASLRASVVVMTMNRPGPLRRCLDSLAAQTMPVDAFEVILVDASDGPVGDVADAYRDRLGLVHHPTPNLGVSANRNTGVRLAHAPVVAFLDDGCAGGSVPRTGTSRTGGASRAGASSAARTPSSVTSIVRRSPGSSASTSTTAAAPGATTGSGGCGGAGR